MKETREALRRVLPNMRQSARKALGVKRPETLKEWEEALSKRETVEEIDRLIQYWMEE